MKMAKNILCAIGYAFLLLIGTILFGGGIAENNAIMIIIGGLLLGLSIYGLITISRKNVKIKNSDEASNDNINDDNRTKLTYKEKVLRNRQRMYRRMKYKLRFVAGLPLMQGALCKLVSTDDKIIINSQGTTFELNKEKIASISVEKNISQYTQAVSSVGGAMMGGMLFGGLGAAIGGRAKSRNFKSKMRYVVISYFDNESNPKYIAFDYKEKGAYLVKDFKMFNKSDVKQRTMEIN